MNFAEFQEFREHTRVQRQDLVDCGATNLYAALARLIPARTEPPTTGRTVHRCHLAAEWAAAFDLPTDLSRRALVSCGVRDSLARLFRHYASVGARVWLPEDNYPVYGELAVAAGVAPLTFPTLPEPRWPDVPSGDRNEVLLITNPLKPLGRRLSSDDLTTLRAWLSASPRRRLVIDAVYTFEKHFGRETLSLFETQQTVLLHSLTKGWLEPRLFGVALVPELDTAALSPAFRAEPPPQANLARARDLLARHRDMPDRVRREIENARRRMSDTLRSRIPAAAMTAGTTGYFVPVAAPWSQLLQDANVLGLPASVFGSRRDDITILSCLSFIA